MVSDALNHDQELLLISGNECLSQSLGQDKEDHPKRGQLRKWLSGWKFTLSLASAGCIIFLSFNVGFLLWAVARDRLKKTRGILYEGDCDQVRHQSTGLHLLINILSTTLLGASNYSMQCLCAPTREDIDNAHLRGNWLDIGVPSLRNLFHVSRIRSLMWICLALSSLPLHLVYNSTIFSTTAAYPYNVFAGHGSLGNETAPFLAGGVSNEDERAFQRLYQEAGSGYLKRLDTSECINAYAITYQTKYGDLLLVTEDVNTTNQYDMVGFQSVYDPYAGLQPLPLGDPYEWLCPPNPNSSCSTYVPSIQSQAEKNNWVVYRNSGTYRVDSCLSGRLPEHCKLQYSLPLTIVVIVVNFIKSAIMCYMAVKTTEPPMLTTGDAITSFLKLPDKRTLGRCLVPGTEVRRIFSRYNVPRRHCRPSAYDKTPKPWYSAVSHRKWVVILILWLIAIAICAFLLRLGLVEDGAGVWDADFGSINAQALIKSDNWPRSLISNTIIANIPQVIFSTLYFVFNSSGYALTRKGVRVSWDPQSAQRSSYFLSLPYRYAIPLMAFSAILHWLISQSLFLVGIEAYDQEWRRSPDRDLMTCGYTPVVIVSSMSVGAFMFICLVGLGFRKFASGMFVAGSCSLAIAAACHPKYDPNLKGRNQELDPPEGIEFMPLKWGAAPVQGELGHCTFSSKEVYIPESGHLYQ
ncbi:hypothetical protein BDW59DRAFT_172616 [Aspergillus cavernicola]|uniref:DUF6536 domain-containing protein n=1 Tax=Aspergillus cavernicola TaxID=176166 RepID=A0ABR4IAZ0_9EURO